jgi:hypothetical protein
MPLSSQLTIEITSAPKKAAQNPVMLKPGSSQATIPRQTRGTGF